MIKVNSDNQNLILIKRYSSEFNFVTSDSTVISLSKSVRTGSQLNFDVPIIKHSHLLTLNLNALDIIFEFDHDVNEALHTTDDGNNTKTTNNVDAPPPTPPPYVTARGP